MRLISVLAMNAMMLLSTTAAIGQQFRVETDIFVDDGNTPLARSLTLFQGEVVYDFLRKGADPNDEEEITVFDPRRGIFTLLDPQRKLKTTLSTDHLLEFTARLKARGLESRQEELVSPQFTTTLEDGWLTLASRRITYRARGESPQDPTAAVLYRQFADWYARLNAMRSGVPPFARLMLNKELANRKLVPLEVERTVLLKRRLRDQKQVARTRHLINWRLSNTDRKRIEDAARLQAALSAVAFPEYNGVPSR